MTSLDDFLPLVGGRLIGCPRATLREAVLASCIEFCERTRLYSTTTDVFLSAGEPRTQLDPPPGVVYQVTALTRDETQRLDPSSRDEFERRGYDLNAGTPVAYYIEGDGQLALGPIPDADETLVANVVIRPADDATSVEDTLYRDWRRPIAAGARAYVRANYEPWFNPELEALDKALFEAAVADANMRRAKGNTNLPLRVRGHYF